MKRFKLILPSVALFLAFTTAVASKISFTNAMVITGYYWDGSACLAATICDECTYTTGVRCIVYDGSGAGQAAYIDPACTIPAYKPLE